MEIIDRLEDYSLHIAEYDDYLYDTIKKGLHRLGYTFENEMLFMSFVKARVSISYKPDGEQVLSLDKLPFVILKSKTTFGTDDKGMYASTEYYHEFIDHKGSSSAN